MKEIKHFVLPEHTNQLYKNEAISSISLTKEVASKINELVDAYNLLNKSNLAKIQEQDGKIRKGIIYMKDNLLNTLYDLLNDYIDSGKVDDIISSLIGKTPLTDIQKLAFDNIDVEYVKDDNLNVDYIVTRIKNLKPELNYTNGTSSNPYTNQKNVIDYMKSVDKVFAINCGLKGLTIRNGIADISENTSEHENWYTLGIMLDGTMKAFDKKYNASYLLSQGVIHAFGIWSPIIEEHKKFDTNRLDHSNANYDYIINGSHPRQAIGIMDDGSYIIVTCDGRMVDEKGLTFYELQDIMYNLGCRNAYNLDGGASTQTVMMKELLSRKISKSRTVGTVLTFEGRGE